VGLGKTIEAGLTLSRLGLTGELETGLLLVPASLQRQWQEELWEKFNINAVRFDRDTAGDHVFQDVRGRDHYPPSATDLDLTGEREWADSPIWRFLYEQQSTDADASSPLDGPTVVIMSWHTARLDDRWDQVAPFRPGIRPDSERHPGKLSRTRPRYGRPDGRVGRRHRRRGAQRPAWQ